MHGNIQSTGIEIQNIKSNNMQLIRHTSEQYIQTTNKYSAPNYSPLEVVLTKGDGVWVWDIEGKKYLDMLCAYSAVNFGHSNKRLTKVAFEQMQKLTMVSRAFYSDTLSDALEAVARLTKMESILFMNSGAEGVETAIKTARRWGYIQKGVAEGKAEIIAFSGNFHGRTLSVISFSDSKESKRGFAPYTPGFEICPYGDAECLEAFINENTVAIIVEPIQGEGGIIMPPVGYLKKVREICTRNNVLMIADEIQTGLCRTGKVFCCEHENVIPDMYIIAKSLGGGIIPVSAVATSKEIFSLMTPGSHGSTFGGNLMASAIAKEVVAIIEEDKPENNSAVLGEYLLNEMKIIQADSKMIKEVRGKGLFVGIDIRPEFGKGKDFSHKLMDRGVLCKDTRMQTLRLAPPLIITKDELDFGIKVLREVFCEG